MPATTSINVKGAKELNRAFAQLRKDVLKELRPMLVKIAEVVRADAERRAFGNITNVGSEWGKMRVGVTVKGVYVAPKMRRRDGDGRPNFAGLLMTEAMQPALDANEARVRREFETLVDMAGRRAGF